MLLNLQSVTKGAKGAEKKYVLEKKQLKSDYIKRENSIFIDNYFKERLEVKEKLGIPVFDVDAIECLIDDSKI